MYKLYSILVTIVALGASGLCLAEQKQGTIEVQDKLPVIVSRGYVVLDGEKVQGLLNHENAKYATPTEEKASGGNRAKMTSPSHLSAAESIQAYNTSLEKMTQEYKQGIRLEPMEEKTEIDYGKIHRLVTSIRKNLCSINPGGSYEVWLQADIGGSAIFVNLSAQTGIKAIIKCSLGGNE